MQADYKILKSDDHLDLEKQVLRALSASYSLVGGVSCSLSEGDDYKYELFCQAVIKASDK